jgi:hypothetical protein
MAETISTEQGYCETAWGMLDEKQETRNRAEY